MGWFEDDTGIKTSKPVHIYDLVVGSMTYRYTSFHDEVIFGGHTYLPIAIDHSAILIVGQGDDAEAVITLDSGSTFVQDNIAQIPAVVCTGQIRRLQNGIAYQYARGPVSPIIVAGRTARVRVGQLVGDAIRVQLPTYVLSPSCQHVLYEGICQSPRGDHDFATTVASHSGNVITVAAIPAVADGWYNDGEVWVGGERRYVVRQEGTTFELLQPFRGDPDGLAATLYDGCRRDVTDCAERHNQVENYGGHPFVKSENPFINRLSWEEV